MKPALRNLLQQHVDSTRRDFLTTTASGLGALALGSMLQRDGLLAESDAASGLFGPRAPHFAARAKSCIFIFLAGAPSQMDLFDPKPMLNDLHGQPLPESIDKNIRFAFINAESARLKGSPRKFSRHGQCGTEFSDLLPGISTCADDIAVVRSMHTEEFNHHPAQLMMNCGVGRFGRPSVGSWVTYGLGSEANDLPSYVVLSAGVGSSGATSNWTNGFLPSIYRGVMFRSQGEPVLNLTNPRGFTRQMQRQGLDALNALNRVHYQEVGDSEIADRIASYELAFRMQMAAPDLIDFTGESQRTLDAYGVERSEPRNNLFRGYDPDAHATFGRNCLLARRMVERGVRFINLYHASWDHHDALDKDLVYNCSIVDQPIATLLKDLKQRGLLDTTLVIFAGEFGRTPLADGHENKGQYPGRDHHPLAFSLWMAGGGIQGGQVVGKTDEIGWAPVEDPVHINDFHATLLHLFGLDHLKLSKRFGGFDIRLTNVGGKVVNKLLV